MRYDSPIQFADQTATARELVRRRLLMLAGGPAGH